MTTSLLSYSTTGDTTMNLAQQFETLGRKQLAIQEGIDLLRQVQIDLARNRASASAWGMVAVLANLTLIPMNCIVNAFQLKAVNTVYQAFVRYLYGEFGKSGTRLDGRAKTTLSLLKQAIVAELKRKGLAVYVPGVNILVGLAEDSIAAWQTVQLVDGGSREMSALASKLERKIFVATNQLIQIGFKMDEILSRMHTMNRTG